jgi:hypothetical protein
MWIILALGSINVTQLLCQETDVVVKDIMNKCGLETSNNKRDTVSIGDAAYFKPLKLWFPKF